MGITIGSARIDENGNITGGTAGDQTGKELSTQAYYMHKKGWYLLRPKSVSIANKIAKGMLIACNNPNIGYDQNGRSGIVKNGVNSKVKTEADCGTTVRACCIYAGFDPGNFSTANEVYVLGRTGQFKDAITVTSDTVLYNGDVLVTKTKGHTVVVVSGNSRTSEKTESTEIIEKTAIIPANSKDSSLKGTYVTTCDLNIRKGPGIINGSMGVLPKSTECEMYGYYTLVGGTKWFYVIAKVGNIKYTGFVSGKLLTRK